MEDATAEMASSGLHSLAPYTIMLIQADLLNIYFPDHTVNFDIAAPNYLAIPITLIISRLIEQFCMDFKAPFSLLMSTLLFCCCPLVLLIMGTGSSLSYYTMLLFYLVNYAFTSSNRGYSLAIASHYNSKFTELFFIFNPVGNVILITLKSVLILLRTPDWVQFLVLWGFYAANAMLLLFFF